MVIIYNKSNVTDQGVMHNKLYMAVWNKHNHTSISDDVSVPMDRNIVNKSSKKLTNYRDIDLEIQKCWTLKTVKMLHIILGVLGTMCFGLQDYLSLISPRLKFPVVRKTVLLGTARNLRDF